MLLTLLALALAPLSHSAWQAHDLSILVPLPSQAEFPLAIAPTPSLLPKQVYLALPRLVMTVDSEELYRENLRVVAARVDPCFREGDGPCQKQLRLVWQPVIFVGDRASTLDATMHTFYPLSEETFEALLRELMPLRSPGNGKLGVHPVLAREGLAGPHWKKLSALLTKYGKGLSRVTVMTVNPGQNIWVFSGVDVARTKLVPIRIPRTNESTTQSFVAALREPPGEFRAGMVPAPAGEEPFLSLLSNSTAAKQEMSERDLMEATRSALRLENPRLTNPGTVDCASCHGAHVIPSWSLRNFEWDWESSFVSELFGSGGKKRKPDPSPEGANVLRAFGYFGAEPVVARRVANEAKLVAESL